LDKIQRDSIEVLGRNCLMKSRARSSAASSGKAKSPSDSKVYLVQGENFRCLACMNKDGKWVDLFTKEKLPKVVHVMPVA
jgi:hypothetical protein